MALARHAAVTWIQEALKDNYTLTRAAVLASERPWGGKLYSASALEGWYRDYEQGGFEALQRQPNDAESKGRATTGPPAPS